MNNTDKALISYLEGEIKYGENMDKVFLVTEKKIIPILAVYEQKEGLTKFIAQAIQEKRDRMKEEECKHPLSQMKGDYDTSTCGLCGKVLIEPRKEE